MKDAAETRRLLAIAAVPAGGSLTEAAKIRKMNRQALKWGPASGGPPRHPSVADLMSLVDHATVLHGWLSDEVAFTR